MATSVLVTVPANAHQACAGSHIEARLGSFSDGSISRPLYWVAENEGPGRFTVQILDTSCDGSTVTISHEVRDGTANSATDYVAPPGSITFVNSVGHPTRVDRNVDITNDPLPDGPVEFATVVLTSAQGGRLVAPTSAPMAIVDDDGPAARLALLDGPYEESETTPAGGVPVFRAGSASGTTTVNYALTAGTATAEADYQGPATGTLTFAGGDRMELIPVTIVDDVEKETPETLTVSISGVGVEGTTSVPFTITDNEESDPPSSTLHHPNNRRRYKASHFLIREIHIFTKDEGGAGVVEAQFALRRNLKNKSCEWWTGKRFKKGDCDKQRWLGTDMFETDFFIIRLKELEASTGRIRDYTAYSKAIDGARNVEDSFEPGRNANTFEIRKSR
jgi:hypothetical protein